MAGFCGVEDTLVTRIAPEESSTQTMSVKVPPVSMPIRSVGLCVITQNPNNQWCVTLARTPTGLFAESDGDVHRQPFARERAALTSQLSRLHWRKEANKGTIGEGGSGRLRHCWRWLRGMRARGAIKRRSRRTSDPDRGRRSR